MTLAQSPLTCMSARGLRTPPRAMRMWVPKSPSLTVLVRRTVRVSRWLRARLLWSLEAPRVPARAARSSRTWMPSRAALRGVARRDPGGTAPALLRFPRMPAQRASGRLVFVRPALRAPSGWRRSAAGAPAEDPGSPLAGGRRCRGLRRLAPPRHLERWSWRPLRMVSGLRWWATAPLPRKMPRREQTPSPQKTVGSPRAPRVPLTPCLRLTGTLTLPSDPRSTQFPRLRRELTKTARPRGMPRRLSEMS